MAAEDLTTMRLNSHGTDFEWSDARQGWICQECSTLADSYEPHGRYHAALTGRLNDLEGLLEMVEIKSMEPAPTDTSWLEMESSAGSRFAKAVRETLRARRRRVP